MYRPLVASLSSKPVTVLASAPSRLLSTTAVAGSRRSPMSFVEGYEYTVQKELVKALKRGTDESLTSARGFCMTLTDVLTLRPANMKLARELLLLLSESKHFVEGHRDVVDLLADTLRPRLTEETISRVQGRALGQMAASIGKLNLPWSEEVTLIARHCTERIGLEMMSATAVVSLASGMSKCDGKLEGFAEALALDWSRRLNGDDGSLKPALHVLFFRSLAHLSAGQPSTVALMHEFNRVADISAFTPHQKAQLFGAQKQILGDGNARSGEVDHEDPAKLSLPELMKLFATCARRKEIPRKTIVVGLVEILQNPGPPIEPHLLANLCRSVGSLLSNRTTNSKDLHQLLELLNSTLVHSPSPLQLTDLGSILWASLSSPSPKVKRLASVLLSKVDADSLALAQPQVQAPVLSGIVGLGLAQDFADLVGRIAELRGMSSWSSDDVRGVSQLVGPLSRIPGMRPQVLAMAAWLGNKPECLTGYVAGRALRAIANCNSARQILTEFPEAAHRFCDILGSHWDQLDASPNLILADVASIMWALATLRLSDYDLQEKCCQSAVRLLRQASKTQLLQAPVLLWALASNAHRTQGSRALLLEVTQTNAASQLPVRELPVIAWAAAVFNVYNEAFLRDILERCSSGTLDSAALFRLHRVLQWATVQRDFQLHGLKDLAARAASEAMSSAIPSSSSFQDELIKELEPLVTEVWPQWEVVSEYNLSPHAAGVVCDIALLDKVSRSPLVLLEADGAPHFVHCVSSDGTRRLAYDGKTELLRRILTALGYNIVSIDTNSWKSTARSKRQNMLKERIYAALKGKVFQDSVSA
ncbi:hypothetical protein FOL47_001637 [Perkinsus chesapeaki]|uniref:RAP domain-containing protein n=1 Tax=Perkinsus chesapeaki TaxID=330153 RepID=A0A7J6N0P4_PERCH|nr:hypothetical protein FOL47_001637 [Perkinsus chesapeaki]